MVNIRKEVDYARDYAAEPDGTPLPPRLGAYIALLVSADDVFEKILAGTFDPPEMRSTIREWRAVFKDENKRDD